MRISVRIDSKAAQAQLRRWGGEFRDKVKKAVAHGIASEATELKEDVRTHVAGQMAVVKKSFVKGFTAKVLDKDKNLIDELTVYENIETPLLYKKVKSGERKAMVCDILDRFNIVGKKDLFPNQLSGGQQQLVGIARALISSPKLLLADEPTGNLNSAQGEEIMDVFKKLHSDGTTIVQVTHSEKNAQYGQRIIHLLDGRTNKEELLVNAS